LDLEDINDGKIQVRKFNQIQNQISGMKLIVDTSNLKEIIKFATSLSGIMANEQPSKTIVA